MKERIVTGLIIALILVPVIGFSEFIIYPIAMALLAVTALYEMFRVLGVVKDLYLTLPPYLFGAVFPLLSFFMMQSGQEHFNVLSVLSMSFFVYLFYIFIVLILRYEKVKLEDAALVFMTSLYIVASFTSLTVVRYMPGGIWNFGIVFITAWVTDIFAYFTGYFFGKHKLSPKISPKKTIEGALGGTFFSILVCLLYGWILEAFSLASVNYIALALTGLVLSVLAQAGDLAASLIKRHYGVKDYGHLMPGHGGVMDRFDSVIAISSVLMILAIVYPPIF